MCICLRRKSMKIRAVEQDMTGRIGRIDRTLLELMAGTIPYGLLCQVIGVFFVENKAGYSIGLWIGIVTAMVMAWHMHWSLDRALGAGDQASGMVVKQNLIRYAGVAVILAAASSIASPVAVFIGIMGLKVSAYIQPFTHKISVKLWKM